MTARRLIVLEDDPTGTQLSAGVPFVLDCSASTLRTAGAANPGRVVHVLTNSRAYGRAGAERIVRRCAAAAIEAFPGAWLMLRGDSTLRGWPLEEVRGACRALGWRRPPVLVLVPAFPQAGRVTLGGTHYLRRNEELVPVHQTEYARDPVFGYRTSTLLDWAAERSDGYFDPAAGRVVDLHALRAGELLAEVRALVDAGRPAVCAPDVETDADVALVAAACARAWDGGLPVIARGSPALGAIAGRSSAAGTADAQASGPVLVVVGSHVPLATTQLDRLLGAFPQEPIQLEIDRLLSRRGPRPVAEAISRRLRDDGLAIVATPRRVDPAHTDIAFAARVAGGVARVIRLVDPQPHSLVTKGGITSAVVAREGVGARWATVLGPVAPGVALWRLEREGRQVEQAVVPGNIGGPDLLAEVVARMTANPILV